MSTHFPTPPEGIPPLPQQPPRPARRTRLRIALAATAAGLLLVAATATVTTLIVRDDGKERAPAAAPEETVVEPADTEETEEPEAELYNTVPDAGEFTLSLKTLSKQCYGSAGCNVEVRPDLTYTGTLPLDPDASYAITYEISGGEDGPVIQTMDLTSSTKLTYSEVMVSTPGSGTKPEAEITGVEYNEYGY